MSHDLMKPRQTESILLVMPQYPASLIPNRKMAQTSGCGDVSLYFHLFVRPRQEACLGFRKFKARWLTPSLEIKRRLGIIAQWYSPLKSSSEGLGMAQW